MPIDKESTPPPKIGKIGPYTVFVTPPKPSEYVSSSPKKTSPPPTPPVQPPPQQFHKPSASFQSPSSNGFFWNAVSKVQNAHSSLDEYVANWFGLNQSKYQWALDDYYGSKGLDQIDARAKDKSSKTQTV